MTAVHFAASFSDTNEEVVVNPSGAHQGTRKQNINTYEVGGVEKV